MKKLTKTILYLLLILLKSTTYSQSLNEVEKTETTELLRKKSNVIYTAIVANNELICVQERIKKLSSNAYYTFYHYDTNRNLIKKVEYKTKQISKVYTTNDSIYLIRYKKKLVSNNPNNTDHSTFAKLKNVEYSYEKASINSLEFKSQSWFTTNSNGKYWNDNPDKFNIILSDDNIKNYLLNISSYNYSFRTSPETQVDLNIKADDSLKRTKNYNTRFLINLVDKNFKNKLSKDLIFSNNIGDFSLEKYRIDSINNSVYLLLSTYDKKKNKLITFKRNTNTKYHIVKITSDNIQYKTIEEEDKSLNTVNMELFENQIICAGIYSDTNDNKLNGFFKLEFDKNNLEPQTQSYLGFTEQFMDDTRIILTNKNRNYRKLNQLSSDYIYFNKNGDCFINIEEYEIIKNNAPMMMPGVPLGGLTLSVGLTYNTPNKRQNGIIAAKISKDNQLVWARKIKIKEKRNTDYISTVNNGVNYILKDHIPETHKQYSNSYSTDQIFHYIYCITINNQGKIVSKRQIPYKSSMELNLFKDNNCQDDIYVSKLNRKVFQIVKLDVK